MSDLHDTTVTTGLLPGLTATLREYFDTNAITAVRDPWDRIAAGFLVQVCVHRWKGTLALNADDLGISSDKFAAMDDYIRWGSFALMDRATTDTLNSLATRVRRLPATWGRTVHWGQFVPVDAVDADGKTAMDHLRDEFAAIHADWDATVAAWIAAYDRYRDAAHIRCRTLASATYDILLDRAAAPPQDRDTYEAAVAERLMQHYPDAAHAESLFRLELGVSYIPMPSLEHAQIAEQKIVLERQAAALRAAARDEALVAQRDELARLDYIERTRLAELRVQKKRDALDTYERETKAALKARSSALIDDFYTGYALEIRQRLHESLCYIQEGIVAGKLSASATRSVRTTIATLRSQVLDGDIELDAIQNNLDAMLAAEHVSPAMIDADIADMSALLQTAITAMGATPRTPKRMRVPPIDALADAPLDPSAFRDQLRARRERLTLASSLAEDLIAQSNIGPDDLRRRVR